EPTCHLPTIPQRYPSRESIAAIESAPLARSRKSGSNGGAGEPVRARASGRIQSWTPWAEGIRPVARLARAGEQTGDAQKNRSKVRPSRCTRSSVGVCSSGILEPSAQAPWSSVTRSSTLGGVPPGALPAIVTVTSRNRNGRAITLSANARRGNGCAAGRRAIGECSGSATPAAAEPSDLSVDRAPGRASVVEGMRFPSPIVCSAHRGIAAAEAVQQTPEVPMQPPRRHLLPTAVAGGLVGALTLLIPDLAAAAPQHEDDQFEELASRWVDQLTGRHLLTP